MASVAREPLTWISISEYVPRFPHLKSCLASGFSTLRLLFTAQVADNAYGSVRIYRVLPRAPVERYQRTDVLRILRITARQLSSWEKAGLFAVAESYSFFDLLQLRKLSELRAKRVRSAVIRDSLRAMQQQVAGMQNPLLEASAFASKSRVAFRHRGASVEPLDGQFVMDFSTPGLQIG